MGTRHARALVGMMGMVAVLGVATPAAGQDEWRWPERAQNLQELPADFPPDRLSAVMRGFANALGVRCEHCHVGEAGQPLSTFDFASDANPKKATARKMLAMLGDINDHLKGIEPSGRRVNMWCHTCHHGLPRPQTLSEALGETYAADGIDATIARYAELRERYYGRGSFDFSDTSLSDLANAVFNSSPEDGLAVLRLNVEQNPESTTAWSLLADGQQDAGDVASAIESFERALQLDATNGFARARLGQLREQQ